MGQLLDKHRGGNKRAARRWQNEEWELVLDREDIHEDTIRGMLEKKDQVIDLEAAKRIKLMKQTRSWYEKTRYRVKPLTP